MINYTVKKKMYDDGQFNGITIDWILPQYGGYIRNIVIPETTMIAASDNTHLSHNGIKGYRELYQTVIRPTLSDEYGAPCVFAELLPDQVPLFKLLIGKQPMYIQEVNQGRALYADLYRELECPQ